MLRLNKITLLVIIFFVFIGNALSLEESEAKFKKIVTEINESFLKAEGIIDKWPSKETLRPMQRLELDISRLRDELRKYILEYPEVIYVDDARYISARLSPDMNDQVNELVLFMRDYPNAHLENLTVETMGRNFFTFENKLGFLNATQLNIIQDLHDLKIYNESAEASRKFIDGLDTTNFTEQDYFIISFAYFYLMKSYDALGDREKTREVCKEAIARLPEKNRETYTKKLKELNSLNK